MGHPIYVDAKCVKMHQEEMRACTDSLPVMFQTHDLLIEQVYPINPGTCNSRAPYVHRLKMHVAGKIQGTYADP